MKEENEKLTDAMEANIEVYKLKIEDATKSLKEEPEAKEYGWVIMDLLTQEKETLQEERYSLRKTILTPWQHSLQSSQNLLKTQDLNTLSLRHY